MTCSSFASFLLLQVGNGTLCTVIACEMQLGSVATGTSIYELVNLRAAPATPANDYPTEVVTAPGVRLYLSLLETRSLGMPHMSTLVVSLGWEAQAPRIGGSTCADSTFYMAAFGNRHPLK